jgi:acetyltransferase-like isoleucine patch superfamily enzyme
MKKMFKRIGKLLFYIFNGHKYKSFHYSSKIVRPIIITPKYISIGKHVQIYHNCRIQGIYKQEILNKAPHIQIKDYVSIQQNLHLTCGDSIIIERNVAIAANVTITDIHHPYEDIEIPIEKQRIITKPVVIGEDSKIYNNSVILPGTILGKHTTIGANSVVSGLFPEYCVIVGSPARVIKKYNFETKKWQKTNTKGEFIDE